MTECRYQFQWLTVESLKIDLEKKILQKYTPPPRPKQLQAASLLGSLSTGVGEENIN